MPQKQLQIMKLQNQRRLTFTSVVKTKSGKQVRWDQNNSKDQVDDLSSWGFYYTPTNSDLSCVSCVYCGGSESVNSSLDAASVIQSHCKSRPKCFLSLRYTASTIQFSTSSEIFHYFQNQEKCISKPLTKTATKFRLSFFGKDFPLDKTPNSTVKSKTLAEAGFIYNLLTDDAAVCLYCDCSLEGWEPTDDPLHEHKRYGNNYCYFLDVLQRESQSKNDSSTDVDTTTSISKTKTNRKVSERGANDSIGSSVPTNRSKSKANKTSKSNDHDPNDDYWNKLPDDNLFDDLVKVAKSPKQSSRQPSAELNLDKAAKSKSKSVKEKPSSKGKEPDNEQNTSESSADFGDILDPSYHSAEENEKIKKSENTERHSSGRPTIEEEASKEHDVSSKADVSSHKDTINDSGTESGTQEEPSSKTTSSKNKPKRSRMLDQLRYSPTFWASKDEPISTRRTVSRENKETKVKEEIEDSPRINDTTKMNVIENDTNDENIKPRSRSRSKQKPDTDPKSVKTPTDSVPKTRGKKRGLKTDSKTTSNVSEEVTIKNEPTTKRKKADVNNSQLLDHSDRSSEIIIPKTRSGRKLRKQTTVIEEPEDILSKNGPENNEVGKATQKDEVQQQPDESVTEEESSRKSRSSKRIAKDKNTETGSSNKTETEHVSNKDSSSQESNKISKKRKTATKSIADEDSVSESQTKRSKKIKLIKSVKPITPTPPPYDVSHHDIDDYGEKNVEVLEETINVMAESDTYKPSDSDHSDNNEKPSISPIRIKKPLRQNPSRLSKMGSQRNDPKRPSIFDMSFDDNAFNDKETILTSGDSDTDKRVKSSDSEESPAISKKTERALRKSTRKPKKDVLENIYSSESERETQPLTSESLSELEASRVSQNTTTVHNTNEEADDGDIDEAGGDKTFENSDDSDFELSENAFADYIEDIKHINEELSQSMNLSDEVESESEAHNISSGQNVTPSTNKQETSDTKASSNIQKPTVQEGTSKEESNKVENNVSRKNSNSGLAEASVSREGVEYDSKKRDRSEIKSKIQNEKPDFQILDNEDYSKSQSPEEVEFSEEEESHDKPDISTTEVNKDINEIHVTESIPDKEVVENDKPKSPEPEDEGDSSENESFVENENNNEVSGKHSSISEDDTGIVEEERHSELRETLIAKDETQKTDLNGEMESHHKTNKIEFDNQSEEESLGKPKEEESLGKPAEEEQHEHEDKRNDNRQFSITEDSLSVANNNNLTSTSTIEEKWEEPKNTNTNGSTTKPIELPDRGNDIEQTSRTESKLRRETDENTNLQPRSSTNGETTFSPIRPENFQGLDSSTPQKPSSKPVTEQPTSQKTESLLDMFKHKLLQMENTATYLNTISTSKYDLHTDYDNEITNFIAAMPEEEENMTVREWIIHNVANCRRMAQDVYEEMNRVYEREYLKGLEILENLPTID